MMQKQIQVLGHRGATGAGAAGENTLRAYELAREQGADGVELDVRVGRDGSLLLHHDAHTAAGRPVAELSLDDRPPSMPTLAQALDVLEGCLVNIEIKNIPLEDAFDPACAVVDSVVAQLAEREGRDRVIVSSFHPETVDRVKLVAPQVATGVLSWFAPTAAQSVDLAIAGGHDAIHPHFAFVTEELVAAAHDAGLAVNVWTVNEPEDLASMAALGVDAVVTDDVPTALRVLRGG